MAQVRIHNFSISLDGYGSGEGQTLDTPFGHAGQRLHQWFFPTATFRSMQGDDGPMTDAAAADDVFASRWADGIGAEIMGRNKFAPPERFGDPEWRGWWGDDPPFHTPVFVLTHEPRPPIEMDGGTTFHFLDATPAEAVAIAADAAGGLDVRIGGGVATAREFLAADLVDHAHLALVPILLGRGERLWDGLEGLEARYAIEATTTPSGVTHLTLTR